MEKSPFTGKSGAIRIQPLTMHKLQLAERHGKREDEISKLRVFYDQKPLVHKGLNLMELYKRHTEGVFIPKAKTVVQHALFQFPTELVDGEDAEYMLRHSLAMTERIWGPDAVIAARVDRDEKSRHVVDVFICPKYLKQTKRESKVAVSMTKHMKELADRYGHEKLSTTNIGRALQEFVYEYFRDEMKLDGVKRGSAKSLRGSDWKSAEKLREQELDRLRAQAEADRVALAKERAEAETVKMQLAQAKERAEADLAQHKAALEEDQRALAKLIEQERQRGIASKAAHATAIAAREELEMRVAQANAERAEIARQKDENSRAMELHLRQLALLARAANDENGLELRLQHGAFAMNKAGMSVEEKDAYESTWPKALVTIGRALAQTLDVLRKLAADLLRQEREVEGERRKNAQIAADQRAHHEKALATLAEDREALNAKEAEIVQRETKAEAIAASAANVEANARAIVLEATVWTDVVEWLGARRMSARVGEGNRIETRDALKPDLPSEIAQALKSPAPEWAARAIRLRYELDCRANDHARKEKELSTRREKLIRSAALCDELIAGNCTLKMVGDSIMVTRPAQTDPTRPRMEILADADIEPWFVPLAKLHNDSVRAKAQAVEVAKNLEQRFLSLSQEFPERRTEFDRERKAVRTYIGNGREAGVHGLDDLGM